MNILFVCKYNNFRSKFAETIFNAKNTNPRHFARSAGIFADQKLSVEIQQKIDTVAQKLGYSLTKEKTSLNEGVVSWADLVVNVASDVDLGDAAQNKQVLNWHIDDVVGEAATFDARVSLVSAIEERVLDLIKDLSKYSNKK